MNIRLEKSHMFCLCSATMGMKNPTKTDLLEHNFPVRLTVATKNDCADPIEPALRRVIGRQAYGRLGQRLYLSSLTHATGFVCACPAASMHGHWPLRVTLAFENKQEMLVRDALKPIVGDAGYILGRADHHRADRPAWHLEMRCVWDAVQFMRMPHPAIIVMGRWHGRNG